MAEISKIPTAVRVSESEATTHGAPFVSSAEAPTIESQLPQETPIQEPIPASTECEHKDKVPEQNCDDLLDDQKEPPPVEEDDEGDSDHKAVTASFARGFCLPLIPGEKGIDAILDHERQVLEVVKAIRTQILENKKGKGKNARFVYIPHNLDMFPRLYEAVTRLCHSNGMEIRTENGWSLTFGVWLFAGASSLGDTIKERVRDGKLTEANAAKYAELALLPTLMTTFQPSVIGGMCPEVRAVVGDILFSLHQTDQRFWSRTSAGKTLLSSKEVSDRFVEYFQTVFTSIEDTKKFLSLLKLMLQVAFAQLLKNAEWPKILRFAVSCLQRGTVEFRKLFFNSATTTRLNANGEAKLKELEAKMKAKKLTESKFVEQKNELMVTPAMVHHEIVHTAPLIQFQRHPLKLGEKELLVYINDLIKFCLNQSITYDSTMDAASYQEVYGALVDNIRELVKDCNQVLVRRRDNCTRKCAYEKDAGVRKEIFEDAFKLEGTLFDFFRPMVALGCYCPQLRQSDKLPDGKILQQTKLEDILHGKYSIGAMVRSQIKAANYAALGPDPKQPDAKGKTSV